MKLLGSVMYYCRRGREVSAADSVSCLGTMSKMDTSWHQSLAQGFNR